MTYASLPLFSPLWIICAIARGTSGFSIIGSQSCRPIWIVRALVQSSRK